MFLGSPQLFRIEEKMSRSTSTELHLLQKVLNEWSGLSGNPSIKDTTEML